MTAEHWYERDRVHELEAENLVLREHVKRLETQQAAVWAVVRESQRLSLTTTDNSDLLDALGTP